MAEGASTAVVVLDLHPTYGRSRFTLRGVFRDQEGAVLKADRLSGQGLRVVGFEERSPNGDLLYLVAAQHDVSRRPRTGIPQRHSADWEATRMAVESFRGIERTAKRKGLAVRWYKELDVKVLRRCVLRYKWSGNRHNVATDILSSTILAHPFPNANHRTSIAFMRLYLHSEGIQWPKYSLRGRGRMDRYHRDVGAFNRQSKYILQFLRHREMIQVAHEEGYRKLKLGDTEIVPVKKHDLAPTRNEWIARHHALAAGFIHTLSDEELENGLSRPNTKTLRDWVAWYESRRSR